MSSCFWRIQVKGSRHIEDEAYGLFYTLEDVLKKLTVMKVVAVVKKVEVGDDCREPTVTPNGGVVSLHYWEATEWEIYAVLQIKGDPVDADTLRTHLLQAADSIDDGAFELCTEWKLTPINEMMFRMERRGGCSRYRHM
jgi:hypothetical protein